MVTEELLKDIRVVSLRAEHQSEELTEALLSLGAEVVHCPLLEFVPNQAGLNLLSVDLIRQQDAIIFTSANGVAFFFQELKEKHISVEMLNSKKIYVVGPKTKEACCNNGINVTGIPSKYDSESILKVITEPIANLKMLIISPTEGRRELANQLLELGAHVTILPVYTNVKPANTNLEVREGDYIVFTSPSTAHRFFNSSFYQNQSIICFCIGTTTTDTVKAYKQESVITSQFAMVKYLIDAIKHYAIVTRGFKNVISSSTHAEVPSNSFSP